MAFLLSDDASFVNGAVVPVDGGRSALGLDPEARDSALTQRVARAEVRPGTLSCVYVIISGPPAAGKSTGARLLAPELALPVIAKDVIKQALMDVLGLPDGVEESHGLGRVRTQGRSPRRFDACVDLRR